MLVNGWNVVKCMTGFHTVNSEYMMWNFPSENVWKSHILDKDKIFHDPWRWKIWKFIVHINFGESKFGYLCELCHLITAQMKLEISAQGDIWTTQPRHHPIDLKHLMKIQTHLCAPKCCWYFCIGQQQPKCQYIQCLQLFIEALHTL